MKKKTRLFFLATIALWLIACGSGPSVEPTAPLPSPPTPLPSATSPLPTSTTMPATATSPPTATPSPETTATPTSAAVSETLAGRIVFYSERDGNPDIYSMNPDGSDMQRLTHDPAYDDAPALSPDGTRIVFLTSRHDPEGVAPNLAYEIYIMDSDGQNQRRLTTTDAAKNHPAWSPDGKHISFDADYDGDGYAEIYGMDVESTHVTRLTFNQANDQFADWAPRGASSENSGQIVFTSDRDGGYDIYIMDADGSNQRPLTSDAGWELFPAWSPDGTQIAYFACDVQCRPNRQDIYVMNADGSDRRRLTDRPRGVDEDPAWSPDGQYIVFQSNRDRNFEIYRMKLDGTEQTRLTHGGGGDYWPSWGPAATREPSLSITFEKSAQTFPSVPTWKIGLADLDADGDLDAVFANGQAYDSQVWLNDGRGVFTDTGQSLGTYGHGVDVGDVDGDGDPDVVISPHNDAPSRVYLNDGKAKFQALEGAFDANIGFSIELFDLDGDSDLDAVGEGSSATHIYLNDGTGIYTSNEITLPLPIVWGDLDADGDVDALIKEESVGYTVRLNENGNFSQHWHHVDPDAMRLGDIALGDVDHDGDLDAIITNGHFQSASYPAMVFINDGTGQFMDSGQRLSAVRNAGVALGDLDADGDLDLVLADYMEPCQIWLNDGNGQFTDSNVRVGGDQFYRHVHLGDLDGDRDLDIFLATFGMNEGPNEIWFNE